MLLLAALCVCLAVLRADAQLNLNLNETTGEFTIQYGGVDWLHSSAFGIRNNGKVLSTGDGSLTLSRVSHDHSASFIGEYRSTTLSWKDSSGKNVFATTFNVYADVIHFEQEFVAGLQSSASGDNNDVISAFPTFNESKSESGLLNYLTYRGTFCGGSLGSWGSKSFSGGFQYGPLVLYDKSLNTFAMSAMDNFMVSYPSRSKTFNGAVAYGIGGKINALPPGFVQSTILCAGKGIKSTMARWGSILLELGKKSPSTFDSDLSISHLGYYTDNGAYYYYKTEPKKNYQQTMLDVKAAAMKLGIPFKYFQFDSWWYYKDSHSAVTLWEPRPDVFPDGMSQWLDMPLVLHNRWWSAYNNYSHDWFVADGNIALPTSEALFDYIMGKAKKWGMIVYEQDWLVTTYERMNVTQATLHDAQNWLLYMGSAAAKLNISIQYCMPLPMHMLQSTTIQPVTQARASGDYHPGNGNWNVGLSSLFYWSIGVVPFKDDFFTYSGNEDGCPYGTQCTEPNFEMETLVAALSGGPVGPSDGVEYLNKELIMRTCRSDGLLLKPDEPAIYHEAAFKLGFDHQEEIQIWHTMSNTSGGITHYILAIDLAETVKISLADLGAPPSANFIAYDYFASCPTGGGACSLKNVQHLSASVPLMLNATKKEEQVTSGRGDAISFQYWVVAETWANGWTPIGQGDKFVPMSKQRVTAIAAITGGLSVSLVGAANEEVVMYGVLPNGDFVGGTVTIPASGQVTVHCIGTEQSNVKCQ